FYERYGELLGPRALRLRRDRARAEAKRLPDEVPRPRPTAAARREARLPPADVGRGALPGDGRRPRPGRAAAAAPRPASPRGRASLERPRPAAARRRACADRRTATDLRARDR